MEAVQRERYVQCECVQCECVQCEYEGNGFTLTEERSWYSGKRYVITKIDIMSPSLVLPDAIGGIPVVKWEMQALGLQGGERVRSLYIPASLRSVDIENDFFPCLDKVQVDPGNLDFSTDGEMLFSADGSRLLYSLAAGFRQCAAVPACVKKIEGKAFARTKCREIIFGNPDVGADGNAFRDSLWLDGHSGFIVIGYMFFRLLEDREELRIPETVRRFHPGAFAEAVPKHLITPVQPVGRCLENLSGHGKGKMRNSQCSEISLLSKRAAVDLDALRRLKGLSAVRIPEGHIKYRSADGVIFSEDMRVLVYYPPMKRDPVYEVPEGTVKIAAAAFAGNGFLQELRMPDTLVVLGVEAFRECSGLEKLRLSPDIREIPDACGRCGGGVFEGCGNLKSVALPEKLQYLGSYAFYGTSLESVCINDELRQMGEYALAAENLREIGLPAGLERLGRGALLYAERVRAYEGTAKGLVSAVNAPLPGGMRKRKDMVRKRCEVTVCCRRSGLEELFLIPGSLKLTMFRHLSMAWDGESIDYEEYDACFEGVTDREERLEFAGLAILRRRKGEESACGSYIRHFALTIASGLVEQGREKEFAALLEKGYLSEKALDKLLARTKEAGKTTYYSYILKDKENRGKRGHHISG